MEPPGPPESPTPEPEVSLADAGIAAEIARAAARGRGADRTPTLEQLLSAFGEREPTPAARQRVAAALEVAGMGVRPSLMEAEPRQRLLLLPPGAGTGPDRRRAAVGLAALAAIVVVAAIAAAIIGGGNDQRASDSLPSTQTTRFTPPATTPTTPVAGAATTATDTTATATDTTATATGTTATTDTTTTATTSDAAAAAAARAERRKKARARRKREAAAKRKRTVSVVVDASAAPTFLCVEDGEGNQLFGGTLSARQTFRARRIKLNVGLASTIVKVNGQRVPLSGSPAGLDITRSGGARNLPLGQRPCG